jgi:hypothetical protein
MAATVQLMALPGLGPDTLPQILLEEEGLWRAAGSPPPSAESQLRTATENLLQTVMKSVGGTPPAAIPATHPKVVAHCTTLWRTILSPEFRTSMGQLAPVAGASPAQLRLYLQPGTEWVPWELLHDGSTFLGLKFCMARLPIMPHGTEIRGPRQREVRQVFNLLANQVLTNGVLPTWESTFGPHSPRTAWECRYPSNGGAAPTVNEIDAARSADIVHITCHGGLKGENNETYWTLDHNSHDELTYHITTVLLDNVQFSSRPLIFGNACQSASGAIDLRLKGLATSFIKSGALNFIGTFAPISKSVAVEFAHRFYQRLFSAMPIGEALRATKQSFADQNHPDPSYLFYCLYGPPEVTYAPA